LQAAIYREVVHLIHQGVVDVTDADTAVCWGPGLRWGIMGPSMLFHLGGGEAGIKHFMEHLSGPVAAWWKDLGSFTEWPEGSKRAIVDGVLKEADGRTIDELAEQRDDVLLQLVKLRTLQAKTLAK
jgi:3-hydroxyacyl-CoA dehydrogenase